LFDNIFDSNDICEYIIHTVISKEWKDTTFKLVNGEKCEVEISQEWRTFSDNYAQQWDVKQSSLHFSKRK